MELKLLGVAAFLAVLIGLSSPAELRKGLGLRALTTLPVAYGIMALHLNPSDKYDAVKIVALSIALFFVWRETLAWHGANSFNALTCRGGLACGTRHPDFGRARSQIDDDKLDTAVETVFNELDKDRTKYEGNVLLASLYKELKKPDEALAALAKIKNNPNATGGSGGVCGRSHARTLGA